MPVSGVAGACAPRRWPSSPAACPDHRTFSARVLVIHAAAGRLRRRTSSLASWASRSATRAGRRRRDRRGTRAPRPLCLTSGTSRSYTNTRCASRSIPPSARSRWLSADWISLAPPKCSPIATSRRATCGTVRKYGSSHSDSSTGAWWCLSGLRAAGVAASSA